MGYENAPKKSRKELHKEADSFYWEAEKQYSIGTTVESTTKLKTASDLYSKAAFVYSELLGDSHNGSEELATFHEKFKKAYEKYNDAENKITQYREKRSKSRNN